MMKFGYLYTDEGFVIYDVSHEVHLGRMRVVATLSASPDVAFAALTEAEAVDRLRSFLHHRFRHNTGYLSA
jgi:hypothetical protein